MGGWADYLIGLNCNTDVIDYVVVVYVRVREAE